MAEEDDIAGAMFGPAPSKDADIASAMFGSNPPAEDVGYLGTIGAHAAKGATFNTADELEGFKAASGMPPLSVMGIPLDTTVGLGKVGYEAIAGRGKATEAFEKRKQEVLDKQKTSAEQYPKTALGSDIAGSLISPLPFAKLKPGAKLADWAAQGTKIGAGAGMLSGIGEGEGGWDRAAKGVTSGVIGAGAGALLGTGMGAAAPYATKAMDKVFGRELADKRLPVEATEGGDDLVTKMTNALREAKPIRESQEAIYHQRRSQQAAEIERIGRENPGEEGLAMQKAALAGKMDKVDYESIRPLFNEENITDLFSRIQKHEELQPFEKVKARDALKGMLSPEGGTVPTRGELALLGKVFPEDFVKAVEERQPIMRDLIGEGLNIPRAIMASTDLSAPLRQGFMLGMAHPVLFSRAIKDMHKYATSEQYYQDLYPRIQKMTSAKGVPLYPVMDKSGLAMTHIDAPDIAGIAGREERMFTNLPDNIPGFGKLYRGSNRGYTGMLVQQRADVFKHVYDKMENSGPVSDEAAAKLADYVNTFSGRGQWSFKYGTQAHKDAASQAMFEKAMPVMNAAFFAPRLMASRGKLITNLVNPHFWQLPKEVRNDALKAYAGTTSAVLTLLGLASWAGADVVTDSTNADFGKVKIGNTRYEITGGILPYVRFLSQLTQGKITASGSGRTMVSGEGYKPMTRADIMGRFLESKESPTAGLLHRFIKQQGFLGKPYSAQSEAIKSVTPLIFQDLHELSNEYSPPVAALAAIPGFYGAGSQTYGKVQFDEGKDKLGLPAAKIGSPPDWGEFASEHASKPWKALFGEEKPPIDSTKMFDATSFYRNNYSKMSRAEQSKFEANLGRNYPKLEKKWQQVLRDERDLKITPKEWDLRVKPVPERVMAIRQELDALPSYEEKRRLWSRYSQEGMGILTDGVQEIMHKLKAIPRIDPTNTIKQKDQREIEKVLDTTPVRRQTGGRVGGGRYTEEELEASRKEDRRFREFLGRIAPRGIPWQNYHRTSPFNIEDRSNEGQVSEEERLRRLAPNRPTPQITDLSRQAGYDDLKARGGKVKRRIPPHVTIPETPATFKKQQQSLIAGHRAAMLFPHKSTELPLPRGMKRMRTKDGLLHFNPKLLKPSQIRDASGKGKMNEILEMGPVSKEEALARASVGEKLVAVTERGPDGVEAKSALGTEQTAPEQLAALQETADPGDWVGVEPVQETLARRMS